MKQNNIDLYNYFPSDYFNSSHAPQVNVHMNEYSTAPCNISLINNLFHDQKNIGILGYSQVYDPSLVDTTYWGQLLAVRTRSSNSIIEFSNNTVYNYVYIDLFSSLIHKSFSGELKAQNNIFFNIGFKATKEDRLNLPVIPPPATKLFDFTSEQIERYQEVGIFAFFENSLEKPGQVHLIKNNSFRKIFAGYCGILNVEHWSLALSDVRIHMIGNYYYEVFAAEAAILRVESKFTKVAAEQEDYLNQNPQ